jgi:hypothetical protein
MTFLDRSQIVRAADRASAAHGKELMAGILLSALIATLAIRNLVPPEALTPAIVTLLFAVGAAAAGAAWLCQADRFRILWFDLAGSLTFIGVVISVLIEPDQLISLCSVSDRSE